MPAILLLRLRLKKNPELFGEKYNDNGKDKYQAFHLYSMKQTIEENFILDVLQNYTTYQSFMAYSNVLTMIRNLIK